MTSESGPDPSTSTVPNIPPAGASPTESGDGRSERHCVRCGTVALPGWDFCGDCGAPLPDRSSIADTSRSLIDPVPVLTSTSQWPPVTVPTPPEPAATPPTVNPPARRGITARRVVGALTVLVLLVLAGVAGYVHQQTRADLARAADQLAGTRAELATTRTDLADTETTLEETKTDLDATQTELDGTQDELRDARRRLTGLQGTLSDAQDRLDLQANDIETLKSCLTGVSTSLGYAAGSDYSAAIAALDAVQVSCERAGRLL